MAAPLDSYFAFNHAAMTVKNQRLEIIAGNIANATTPGYKAKDLDFESLLRAAFDNQEEPFDINAATTDRMHLSNAASRDWRDTKSAEVFTVPLSPSLDGNTVEIGVEQARYGRAIADYQASLQFMESRISGLRKALRGE